MKEKFWKFQSNLSKTATLETRENRLRCGEVVERKSECMDCPPGPEKVALAERLPL